VCGLFDGSIGGGVHILLIQVWVSFIGLPFGLLAFLVYALMILRNFINAGDRTMGGTEKRRRGLVAEVQRFFDCFNQVDTATGSIFFLLAILGPSQGPGSSLTAVGAFGTVAVVIVAVVRWMRGRNEPPSPTAEDR
jgi:hypothetical protein